MSAEVVHILLPIALAVCGALFSILLLMLRKLLERINELEKRQYEVVTRDDVRIMINERISPIEQRITAIDAKLDRIINIMLSERDR